MKKLRLALFGVVIASLLVGTYLIFVKESPATKYLRASCDEIKSNPLSKGVDSNEKLLKILKFNLDLAEKADKKQTLDLSLYIDDLKSYIDLKKQTDAELQRKFQLDLALGILGDRDADEIVDDAVQGLQKQGSINNAELSQKLIGLKNSYKKVCKN